MAIGVDFLSNDFEDLLFSDLTFRRCTTASNMHYMKPVQYRTRFLFVCVLCDFDSKIELKRAPVCRMRPWLRLNMT